jgi:hypothetical protein
MRLVAFVTLLASCASWRPANPRDLAMHDSGRVKRVFVVTQAEAFELDLTSSDELTLRGDVVHAWTVPSPEGVVYKHEGPFEMAERLRWNPQHTIPEQVIVPISSVRYARKRSFWNQSTQAIVAVSVVGFLVLGTVMVVSLSSIGDVGNE